MEEGYLGKEIERKLKDYVKGIIPENNLAFYRRNSFPFSNHVAVKDILAWVECRIPENIAGGPYNDQKSGKYHVPVKIENFKIFGEGLFSIFLREFGEFRPKGKKFEDYFYEHENDIKKYAKTAMNGIQKIEEVVFKRNHDLSRNEIFEICFKDFITVERSMMEKSFVSIKDENILMASFRNV